MNGSTNLTGSLRFLMEGTFMDISYMNCHSLDGRIGLLAFETGCFGWILDRLCSGKVVFPKMNF